ncbi:hypothetical protein TNCV_4899891, partial [Trichonephila clavipes]
GVRVTSLLRTSTAVGIFVGPDTHVHLAAAAQPLLTPRNRTPSTGRGEKRDALNLHGSGGQRILLSQNIDSNL